jgi:hypothetical protein
MAEDSTLPGAWMPLAGDARWVEALHCSYPDDPDVIVSIRRTDSGYEVRETSRSRQAAPKETVVGLRESLAAARELMIQTCRDWDSWVVRRPTLGCS